MESRSPNCEEMRFFVKELVLFFDIFKFLIERSKEFLRARQVSGRPLARKQEDECVSKTILKLPGSGGARLGKTGGRATPKKTKVSDCTMGFQGEDPAIKLHRNTHCTILS